jgi:hypothetical protein
VGIVPIVTAPIQPTSLEGTAAAEIRIDQLRGVKDRRVGESAVDATEIGGKLTMIIRTKRSRSRTCHQAAVSAAAIICLFAGGCAVIERSVGSEFR